MFKKLPLILTLLITIIIRLIYLKEVGIDSFFLHSISRGIISNSYIGWNTNIISFFSLGKDTYAPITPILLSILSSVSNVSIEKIILIFAITLSIVGMLGVYFLVKYISKKESIALICAILFSLSPLYIYFTIWTASGRSVFVSFFPYFLLYLLKEKTIKDYIAIVLLGLLLILSHKLGYLIIIILIAYLISIFLKNKDKKVLKRFVFFIIILSFILLIIFKFKFDILWWQYQDDGFFKNEGFLYLTLNIIFNYLSKLGLAAIFGLISCFIIIFKNKVDKNLIFLLFSIILVIPMLFFGQYIVFYLLPLVSIISYTTIDAILSLKHIKKKIIIKYFILTMVIACVFSSIFMFYHWDSNYDKRGIEFMPSLQEEKTISFIKNEKGNCITNDLILANRVTAYTNKICGPVLNVIFLAIKPENEIKTKILDIKSIIKYRSLLINIDYHPQYDFERIIKNAYTIDSKEVIAFFSKYEIGSVIITNKPYVYKSKFITSVEQNLDKVYSNKEEEVYILR